MADAGRTLMVFVIITEFTFVEAVIVTDSKPVEANT
jgi:hypothetical protein